MFDVKFTSSSASFNPKFEKVNDISDGGYERGLAEGYESGKTEGLAEGRAEGRAEGQEIGYADALAKRTDLVITENGEYTPSDDSTGFKSVSVNVPSKLAQKADGTLTELTASDLQGVTKIVDYAFQSTENLTYVVLSKSVVSIGGYSFQMCRKIKSFVFEEGSQLKTIGNYSFSYFNELKEIELPETLESIAANGFQYNTKLERCILKSKTPPTIQANSFGGCNALKEFTVPIGSGDLYRQATNWSAYADKIVEGDM